VLLMRRREGGRAASWGEGLGSPLQIRRLRCFSPKTTIILLSVSPRGIQLPLEAAGAAPASVRGEHYLRRRVLDG
jgi:hypothetical protein